MGREARDSSKRQLDLGSKAFFWVLSIQGRENGILVAVGGNIPQNFDNSTEEAEATGFSNTMEVWNLNLSTSVGWSYEKDFRLTTGTGHLATVVLETSVGELKTDPVLVSVFTMNAINNKALSNVRVNYTMSNRTQDTITTDSNGRGEISPRVDLLPGLLVLTASLDGFITASVEVQIPLSLVQSVQTVPLSLSPILDPHTEMRLVMSWGRLPKDLDLHVLKINRHSGAMCETYYKTINKEGCSGLSLDVDNTKGGNNGAETITFDEPGDSLYLMYVYDYPNDFPNDTTRLVQSEARIDLYSNNGQAPIKMEVPTKDTNTRSRWWIIGHMDGKSGVSSFATPRSPLSTTNPKLLAKDLVHVQNQELVDL